MRTRAWLSLTTALLTACAGDELVDEFGIDETLTPVPFEEGKEDNAGKPGMRIATDTSRTQVWYATAKWEDKDGNGKTWDQRYSEWVAGLQVTRSVDGYNTFVLSTPWGKNVAAPSLECAEAAIFLRATFAAWHKLPFFMEARGTGGVRVFFGHFGIRTAAGRYAGTPEFAIKYKDYSAMTAEELASRGWPRDEALRQRAAAGLPDDQPALGEAHFGAYLDEAHLNKRVGHLIIYLVNYFGSANLADTASTYNLRPEALRAGDLLLHRWQASGVGDTKIVYYTGKDARQNLVAKLMSGSMPRRQPKMYDETESKGYFTEDDTGGPSYYAFGGGVKRWRVTKNVGGYWTNTWMAADEASWINSTDRARIEARPSQFETLLGEVSPQEKAASLKRQITDARAHLMRYPASCAARSNRERAFRELYDMAYLLGTTRANIDRDNRVLADHVFAELDYTASKTCCWNSSTPEMAAIIMAAAEEEQQGQCRAPTVFMNQADGYKKWSDWAAAHGRGGQWRAWSEDEACPQRGAAKDAETPHDWRAWCPRP